MKRSTLVIACLLSVTSIAAVAEDGSDRARARWEAFQASHAQAHVHTEAAQKTLTAQTKNNGSSATGTTEQKQQPDT
ncbi:MULTISPECIES: hypothetical protein [Pseudomonas]|uniref:hypothetical protein n=1 Tax=Pseudomonas TaxID=286 RepID=UPI000B34F5B6|nr:MULTISPECIES: hypothetical protein [Pseudomonas]PMY62129.1 hypothetical protein C1Y31_23365 [Pseudomonas sp. FW305-25]PMY63754.1 hypothetical protein C1Y32_26140 [Pseudomonas sp. FW126-L8]PNA76574.1 hypothetical protein C1Y33_20100 [Pseudomonas sp. FW305-76]